MQERIEAWHEKLRRAADLAKKRPYDVHLKTLLQSPEAIAHVANYVGKRGYRPTSNIDDLCAQAAHAWDEHISETQDHYDPENYDPDNFGFGKAKGKARRKAKRAKRKERRKARRTRRKAKKAARRARKHKGGEDASDIVEAASTGEEKAAEDAQMQQEAETAAEETQGGGDAGKPVSNEVEEEPSAEADQEELASPDDVEAEAENFGEMFDEFDGFEESDMPLYFASALEVGRNRIYHHRNNMRASSYDDFDLKKIGNLFKKDGAIGKLFKKKKGGTAVGNLIRDVKIGDAVDVIAGKKQAHPATKQALKKTVESINDQVKAKNVATDAGALLKKYGIWIGVAILALILIMRKKS